jgi:DNA polymerase III subunit delta
MIIFLFGEDAFRSNEKLVEIKNKFLEKNKEGVSLSVFDFAEKDWNIGEMVMNISAGGLFSLKKMAIVKNILGGKKEFSDEKFEKFLKNESKKEKSPARIAKQSVAGGDLILIFWESGKVKKSGKLYKLLQKIAKCQEFELLDGAKLKNWIESQFKENDIAISQAAIEKLIIFIGNDLNLLSREIEKLATYKNKGEISSEDIDSLVKSKIDTDIFKTVDALARGDKRSALKMLHDHLEAGEDPFYLLSMYFYQFRNLVKVKPLAEKNMSPQEISAKLKMHPFVARKSLDQARNFSWEKLKAMYKTLCEIDFESKTGKTDITLALDKFVAGI